MLADLALKDRGMLMELQFFDRILTCSDCHSDFIFTAGEQLFFYEKQFKNDPKRCKGCKARRASLATAAAGAEGPPATPARTETRTSCSDCSIETTVPFKPTQGRPVLCRQCYQKKLRMPPAVSVPGVAPGNVPVNHFNVAGEALQEVVPQSAALLPPFTVPAFPQAVTTEDAAAALAALPRNALGNSISPEAALMAAVSISGALAHSSIATLEDLQSIASMKDEHGLHPHDSITSVPYELLTDVAPEQVELLAAMVEVAEA